jgi:TetR/AcrR family transcriptional regulator, cholesterol catabolism regulator
MARRAPYRAPGRPRRASSPVSDARFHRRLNEVLAHATEVFCEKGYEGASMRDLSRAAGMSLAGLYHYFGSKEHLLYLIQKHTFTTILEKLKSRLDDSASPEQRIRIFIENHLEYFLDNQPGMKVLSHEDEALKNGLGSEIAAIKREYYRICLGLMEALKRERGLDFDARTAVMSLFGMMNWIYTWYNPRVDGRAKELAHRMGDIFLGGVTKSSEEAHPQARRNGKSKPRAGISRRH